MKHLALALAGGFAVAGLLVAVGVASPPNISGTWVVEQSGANGVSTSQIVLTQSGKGIIGKSAKTGTGFSGTFDTDSKIDGKWNGPSGAGWFTIYVSPNGHSFNGEWGYNGRSPNGSFVGNEVLPPSPVTAAGKWDVKVAGGPASFVGPMTCSQSGEAVVCHVGKAVLNGKFLAPDKVRATWNNGADSGWFSFWFNDDNNSFNGVWGNGADTTSPVGRVVGQRSLDE
jgi:hypothetical protein